MDTEEHLPKGKKWLCQRCGNCCRRPGPVIVSGKEIDKMANFLEMDPEKFLDLYVSVTPDGENLTLISKPDESCILLDGTNKCMVNDAKPDQCSGFPNTWFFEGWRDMCGAILINEDDFDQAVIERDKDK
ncbi:MAG: YkgJ family cysteine cluster protein [Lentisphaeraceae bacterium]|nr:YkgJ family cysteine cluster protein [Lentisphaeraceae bacterium]